MTEEVAADSHTRRVVCAVALHARPAALIVQAARAFAGEVLLSRNDEDKRADAKSLNAILALGAEKGTDITIWAQGPDAASTVTTVAEIAEGRRK